jgi:hypothetical protein
VEHIQENLLLLIVGYISTTLFSCKVRKNLNHQPDSLDVKAEARVNSAVLKCVHVYVQENTSQSVSLVCSTPNDITVPIGLIKLGLLTRLLSNYYVRFLLRLPSRSAHV